MPEAVSGGWAAADAKWPRAVSIPASAEGGGTDEARRRRDFCTGRPGQALNQRLAGLARAGKAAPEPQIAIGRQGGTDRGEIRRFILNVSGDQSPAAKLTRPGAPWAMMWIAAKPRRLRQGGGDLTGSGPTPVEQNRLDARTQ